MERTDSRPSSLRVEEPLDPLLQSKMDDWGQLFDCQALIPSSAGGSAPKDLEYMDPAFTYGASVVNGKSFLHPSTDDQVWFYSVHDSEAVKLSLELTTCFLMLLPALYQPYCATQGYNSINANSKVMMQPPSVHRVNDQALTALLVIGIVVQFADIYLYFKSSTIEDLWSWRNITFFDNHRFWMLARILTCVAIFIDCLVYFAENRNPLIMRALFPIIFISRRENLQHLFEGTYFAIRKSIGIYRVVILTLAIWSFTGYCLFNRLSPGHGKMRDSLLAASFLTYWDSLATCFKCYLSRPSVLYTLNSYFELNGGSALFFVTLTLVADIFGSSLIIATGTRHFRDFSLLCFKSKLRNRRNGLLAIFDVLEDLQLSNPVQKQDQQFTALPKAGELSYETWLTFCSSQRGKHFLSKKEALVLYMVESPNLAPISKVQFFRLCGGLACKPKFMSEKTRSSTVLDGSRNPVLDAALNSGRESVNCSSDVMAERVSSVSSLEVEETSDKDAEVSLLDLRRGLRTFYVKLRRLMKKAIKFSLTEAQRHWMVESSDFLAHYGAKVEFKESNLGKLLKMLGVKTRLKFKPFSLLSLGMHGLLIYAMVAISSPEPPYSSIVVCWLLLLFFAFENFVHYLAGSEDSHTTLQDSLVNVLVFLTMCCMNVSKQGHIQNQTALTLFIVFQSLRSLKLFAVLKGAGALYSIRAILFRAFLLIGFAIYFFAIFGHCFFCGAFQVSSASDANDDAKAWTRYAEILNFDSFLLSCYTLMQVVVISNWSMVMDATLEVFPIRGFFFFYFFKALMSLAIMPLMISLIIQTFITQLGIAEVPSIRQKLKVYRISCTQQVTSSMVGMWSPNGREVVQSPPRDMRTEELAVLNIQISAKLAEVAHKKSLLQDAIKGNPTLLRVFKSEDHLTEITASVDHIPASELNVSSQRTRFAQAGLQWLDTSVRLQDLRILLEMKEWVSLVSDASLRRIGEHERLLFNLIEKKYFPLEPKYYADVAYLWFQDSIHARHIALPKNKLSLSLYRTHRSRWFLNLCNVLVILQILSALLVSSPCPRGDNTFPASGYTLQKVFASLNLIVTLFYGTETATNLYLGGQGGNWTRVRLSCCLFVAIDTFIFLSGINSPQKNFLYSSAVFPLFWITRSNTFREVVMGLFLSLRKSTLVYNLLLAFLVMWSLLGFYLFHRYTTPLQHFSTFPSTILAVLHCFTAAPYALDALQPLYHISPAVVIYFLIITLSMEIVTISLVVATSDMQFRLFASNNLKRRLSLRRDALLAIWYLFSRDERLGLDNWLVLCKGMRGDFEIDARSAGIFFFYVTNNRGDGATQVEFFRLMAMIHSQAVAIIASESDGVGVDESTSERSTTSVVELSRIYAKNQPGSNARTTVLIKIHPKKATLLSSETLSVGSYALFRRACQWIMFTDIYSLGKWRFKLLEVITFCVHLLLIPQVMMVASESTGDTLTWVKLGWFLEFCFWGDMICRLTALGELTFLRRESHVARAVINFISIVLQLDLGYPYSGDGTTLRLLVLVQCMRLFLMFWFEQGASQISSIFKVAARCLFLLFSVIFFFTIYAQNSFCNFMQPELVLSQMYINTPSGKELATDDSTAWVLFQELLNFDSFLQSMFTLFEIAVLGSWSMIMDAAAKTNAVKAFGFFYPYRLIITLAVLPLLNGLVIRSYVLLMDQKVSQDDGDDAGGETGNEGEEGDQEEVDDLDDVVVSSDEMTMSNRRISLRGRRGSRIIEAQQQQQQQLSLSSSSGKGLGAVAVAGGAVQRIWRGLTVTVLPSTGKTANATKPDKSIQAEPTHIDRNSFLSFWATGSGSAGLAGHDANFLHKYESIHLSHENISAELGRLDEALKRCPELKS